MFLLAALPDGPDGTPMPQEFKVYDTIAKRLPLGELPTYATLWSTGALIVVVFLGAMQVAKLWTHAPPDTFPSPLLLTVVTCSLLVPPTALVFAEAAVRVIREVQMLRLPEGQRSRVISAEARRPTDD